MDVIFSGHVSSLLLCERNAPTIPQKRTTVPEIADGARALLIAAATLLNAEKLAAGVENKVHRQRGIEWLSLSFNLVKGNNITRRRRNDQMRNIIYRLLLSKT
jgi:hypothetical protein